MAHGLTLVLALLAYCACSLAFGAKPQLSSAQQVVFESSDIHIRPATELDLDDIVTVIIDAFSPGPLYHYVFPQFDKFRRRLWQCSREELGREFANLPADVFLNVIAVTNSETNGIEKMGEHGRERVVAVAVWNILEPDEETTFSQRTPSFGSYLRESSCEKHVGLNLTRAADYSKQYSAAERRYIDDYPGVQLYLNLLATHPKWDGLGFGAAHCHWGMAMASKMGLSTTLIATPAGWPLYDSLGFESVANITIKTLDFPDNLWFEYMRYNYTSTITQME